MAVQGPLARTADDLELALDVIAGPEVGEEVAWRLELPPARGRRLADYRVAVLPSMPWLPVDAEIMAAQERVVATLSGAGARVQEAQPEGFGDVRPYYVLYLSILAALVSTGRPAEERRHQAEQWRSRGGEFDLPWALGLEASASDYVLWFGRRELYRAAYRAFFRDWDVLLAPITLVPAFPHTDAPMPERTLEINGQRVDYNFQLVYPSLANLTGQPATAFPVGFNRAGLPIGLQVIGPNLEDRTPIRFAALVERELGGFRPPPGYAEG
jgi:amidase